VAREVLVLLQRKMGKIQFLEVLLQQAVVVLVARLVEQVDLLAEVDIQLHQALLERRDKGMQGVVVRGDQFFLVVGVVELVL
jgi:hypothetical protein